MNQPVQRIKIEISTWAVIKVVLAVLAVLFLFYVQDIVLILFVSMVLAAAFNPWTDWLQKRSIPRPLAILTLYLLALIVLILTVGLLIPPLSQQVSQLSDNFPVYWQNVTKGFFHLQQYSQQFGLEDNVKNFFAGLQGSLDKAASGLFSSLISFFGGLAAIIIILVLAFYLVVEQGAIKKSVKQMIPLQYQEFIIRLYSVIQERLGWWLRGQLILALIIGVFAYIGLTILGVEYAAVLALLSGITEVIPYLGPVIAAIPAVFFAFTQSPFKALMVIILFYVIHWTENNLIVPKVMQKTTGLNPIVVIVAILLGAKLAGFWGILLAVPTATIISILVNELSAVGWDPRSSLEK
ncbi:MAG: AI-2E family transporter [Candidatus Buchananbacteria bacterium]